MAKPPQEFEKLLAGSQEFKEALAKRGVQAPKTRDDLYTWIQTDLGLEKWLSTVLISFIKDLFSKAELDWEESKNKAVQAVIEGVRHRNDLLLKQMDTAFRKLSEREATVSNITKYFEGIVAELTEQARLDPKTRLINFRYFIEQLEVFLGLEQRGHWSAIGLVDITSFKWYNDKLGHALGDRIINKVAEILAQEIRPSDILVHSVDERKEQVSITVEKRLGLLHARFGGDEFCFHIPDVNRPEDARQIANRFRLAVSQFDWSTLDPVLGQKPVKVDVGVVCLKLGEVEFRRPYAKHLAQSLLDRADQLMYEAKGEQAEEVNFVNVQIQGGSLVDVQPPNGA